eukprot:356082-Chlamydomonas_euryale.AAC.6
MQWSLQTLPHLCSWHQAAVWINSVFETGKVSSHKTMVWIDSVFRDWEEQFWCTKRNSGMRFVVVGATKPTQHCDTAVACMGPGVAILYRTTCTRSESS